LKWKMTVVLPLMSACEFASVPFTVKSPGWTVAGSAELLRLIMKSVGGLNITLGQEVVTEQPVGVGVGVGLGGTVAVGVAVAVAVAVEVAVAVAVGIAVGVNVAVAVAVGVTVGVNVAVAVAVGVDVDVAVAVGVGVGVPPGMRNAYTLLSFAT
jgi:hypothetical protein